MNLLFKYAKKFEEKKGQEHIIVGVLGMPNVGKSSVINVLKNKPICNTGSTPFITRGLQEVRLNSKVNIIDSPGLMLMKTDDATGTQIIRSSVQVEDLADPVS